MTPDAELPVPPGEPSVRDERRRRNVALVVTALVFPFVLIGHDVIARRTLFAHVKLSLAGTYLLGVLISFLFWGLGFEAARHPSRWVRAAAIAFLAFTASLGAGGQHFFRGITNGYVNRDAVLLALGVKQEVTGYLAVHAREAGLFFLAPPLIITAIALLRTRRFGPRVRRPWLFAGGGLLVALFAMFAHLRADWDQCLPPDLLWLDASAGPILLATGRVKPPQTLPAGQHEELPTSTMIGDDAPPIVVLLGESVRRDEVCMPGAPDCAAKSPHLEAAAPGRIGFTRASSVASCTELVAVTLWSGLPINAPPPSLARAPLLWDWAKSRGYRTAYLSSQNLSFQNLGLYLKGTRIDLLREGRDRDPSPNIDVGTPDELATGEAIDFIEKGGPSFVLVHFSNTHLPYRQVPGFTALPSDGSGGEVERRNAYTNAVRHNDWVIGDFMSRLRKGARGRRAIVISLSDHGEAWNEHRVVTHSWDLYAEQIDVPFWIDAPEGTLPDGAAARLREAATLRPVITPDVNATVIDLLGGLDQPSLTTQAARLAGTSLLRDPPGPRMVPLWNCTLTRPCIYHSFGLFGWPLKLHYVGREFRYVCSDVEADPSETTELPMERCAALRAEMQRLWPGQWVDIEGMRAKK